MALRGRWLALKGEDVGVLVREREGVTAIADNAEATGRDRVGRLNDRAGMHVDIRNEIISRTAPRVRFVRRRPGEAVNVSSGQTKKFLMLREGPLTQPELTKLFCQRSARSRSLAAAGRLAMAHALRNVSRYYGPP